MKITIGRLRELISEAMVTPEGAIASGVALLRADRLGMTYYVLYRRDALRSDYKQLLKDVRPADAEALGSVLSAYTSAAIVAAMTVEDSDPPKVGEVVSKTRGYGPLLYDAAMILQGGLSPSTGLVSDAASSVWKKYGKRRDVEVKHMAFSDVEEPDRPSHLNVVARHKKPNRAAVRGLISAHENEMTRFEEMSRQMVVGGNVVGAVERSLIRSAEDMLRSGAR